MSLRHPKLKKAYDSDSDDILNSFYIPMLSQATEYRRLAGFFSSTSLAIAAKGISELIRNGGSMKLICCARLSEADVNVIREAEESPEEVIERSMIQQIEQVESRFVRDHVCALGWMIAKRRLTIKIVLVLSENGSPLSARNVECQGVFHQKIGVLIDSERNRISFSGSVNESASGWLGNIEEFKVFRSWVDSERDYLKSDEEKFNKYWNNLTTRAKVIDIPIAIRKKLIEIAPANLEKLNLEKWTHRKTRDKGTLKLWDHQKRAIRKWMENDQRGILEMATGTGKTHCALGCLKSVMQKNRTLVTVITCPYIHLVKQWLSHIEKSGFGCDLIVADSTNSGWKDKLTDSLLDINNGLSDKLIVLTTHSTFSNKKFIDIIGRTESTLMLIADEVHGVGARTVKKGLLENYQLRLGLSATPARWFDDKGTDVLLQYFGGTVFEFGLYEAINRINPTTGYTYLVPYEYRPYFVGLTDDEWLEYEEKSKSIARIYHQTEHSTQAERLFSLLCIKRQKIVKNAARKFEAFRTILNHIGAMKQCLIYCLPEQLNTVQDILNSKNIIQHKFTFREGTRPNKAYGRISEREFLLRNFAKGEYQALVAIKCLDEGVDVPPANTAVILASSGNPREYIQRRGRILRRFPGKDKAIIYDIIVLPSMGKFLSEDSLSLERRILQKELKRYKEFSLSAINVVDCLKKIGQIEEQFKMVI